MSGILALLALGVVLWFWQDSLRAREQARAASKRVCREYNVQLLDDTVALDRIGLRRSNRGRLCFERRYVFEFTTTGSDRNGGVVVMVDARVDVLALDGGDLFIP